jgi:hypothetical protein
MENNYSPVVDKLIRVHDATLDVYTEPQILFREIYVDSGFHQAHTEKSWLHTTTLRFAI